MFENRLFEKLDLNLLKVFEALWQHRNMTRVAEALHITPSAVSHAMRR
ncbi:MAG TPA: LysR family transcriptional regulator, partial [Alteromonas macleodii]|nr:LysR family transcriptional regulator [Alteromonas macleodii]